MANIHFWYNWKIRKDHADTLVTHPEKVTKYEKIMLIP